jgi:hypothetical protein
MYLVFASARVAQYVQVFNLKTELLLSRPNLVAEDKLRGALCDFSHNAVFICEVADFAGCPRGCAHAFTSLCLCRLPTFKDCSPHEVVALFSCEEASKEIHEWPGSQSADANCPAFPNSGNTMLCVDLETSHAGTSQLHAPS